jgi:hypothetical protein
LLLGLQAPRECRRRSPTTRRRDAICDRAMLTAAMMRHPADPQISATARRFARRSWPLRGRAAQ